MNNSLSRKSKVLFLSISKLLTSLSGIASAIFLSRLLNLDEYATYRQTILVYSFLAPLLSLGFTKAIYYNFEHSKDNQPEQILNVHYVILSVAILFSLFFALGGSGLIATIFHNPLLEKTIVIYSVFSIFNLPFLILQPVLVIRSKVKLLTLFNIVNRILTVLVIIGVAFWYREASSIIIAILFMGIISFIAIEVILIQNLQKAKDFSLNKKITKQYYKIGIPLVLGNVIGIAGKHLDQFIVSTIMTPSDLAIYANGAIEIPLIGAITGAIMVIILVDFTKMLKAGKVKETFQLWSKAVEITSSILIPIMFILLLNADWLIVNMFGDKYADSAMPFKIYLLLLPMRTMTFTSLITSSGDTKILPKGAIIFLVLNLFLSLVLIKFLGYTGPAIATVIASYVTGFYFSYKIAQKVKVSIFKVFSLKSMREFLIVGLISYLICYFLNFYIVQSFYGNIIINFLFISVFFLGIIIVNKLQIYKDLLSVLKRNN
jgi:O-antigen/teichoic acid export membrane protein